MAFRDVEPGVAIAADPILPGQATVSKGAKLTLLASDLEKAGIGPHYCRVMADPDNFRVALRAVREGEEARSVTLTVVTAKSKRDTGRRNVNITQALRLLGVEAAAVAGRYAIDFHGKAPGMVIILSLTSPTKEERETHARVEARSQEYATGLGKARP